MRTGFRRPLLATCALATVVLSSCGSSDVSTSGTLAPPSEAEDAYTYNRTAAPPGAELTVESWSRNDGTQVELTATGLQPNSAYGAHVHVRPCGETGDAAGPHYQHEPAPPGRANDPAYANPSNEIWLDFSTDAQGSGRAISTVRWQFGDRVPASVVLHERVTSAGPGEAGEAGARIACLTVPFDS
jgi:Cu-Zn family superoxide dismutase